MQADIRHAPHGYVLLNADGEILEANKAAMEILGLTSGLDMYECVHKDYRETFACLLNEAECDQVDLALGDDAQQIPVCATRVGREKGCAIWLTDQSSVTAIKGQLQAARTPDRRLIRELRHSSATAMGYGELIHTILSEEHGNAAKTLEAVRKYHAQLMEHLHGITGRLRGGKQDHRSASRKHVLVVDDELVVAELITELMRARAYKVTMFTDPRMALKSLSLSTEAYDVAIIDHDMPDLDGAALAEAIGERLPVVLCTTRSGRSLPFVDQMVSKPVDLNQLARKVEVLLEDSSIHGS